ncbi:hypothetical protein LCGC14_1258950 [marine sediment metagenome]|uniref:Nucleoside 2-deoxyribosyltransferase n=1 Tax=marine sediment metagenome TaxID=412755 RepID=A0A0F9NHZ0_9ZZZZ
MGESHGMVSNMKIYLASGFHYRQVLRRVAAKLKARGHEVVSSWIWIEERPERGSMAYFEFAKEVAAMNLVDLKKADAIIVDGHGIREGNHGGVHTELGFALGTGLSTYLVGPRSNTFHWLPEIMQFQDWDFLFEQGRV